MSGIYYKIVMESAKENAIKRLCYVAKVVDMKEDLLPTVLQVHITTDRHKALWTNDETFALEIASTISEIPSLRNVEIVQFVQPRTSQRLN